MGFAHNRDHLATLESPATCLEVSQGASADTLRLSGRLPGGGIWVQTLAMTGGSAGIAAIREPREFAKGLLVLSTGARVVPRGSYRMKPDEVFPEGAVGSPLDVARDPVWQRSRLSAAMK